MTDRDKDRKKQRKSEPTKAAGASKPRAPQKSTSGEASKSKKAGKPVSAGRPKMAGKPVSGGKPKKTTPVRVQRVKPASKTVEIPVATRGTAGTKPTAGIEPLVQNVSRQAPPVQEPPAPAVSEEDSLLLEWQAPVERPRRGMRPADKRRELPRLPERPVVNDRSKDHLLDIPAWPELSDGPIVAPAPVKPVERPRPVQPAERPRPVQPEQRLRPVQPVERPRPVQPKVVPKPIREDVSVEADKKVHGPQAQATGTRATGENGMPAEVPAIGEDGLPIKRRRRRRRRGRNRGQNGQNSPQVEADSRLPVEGERVRQPLLPREQEPHRDQGPRPERKPDGVGGGRQPQEPRPVHGQRPDHAPRHDDRRDERGPRKGPEHASRGPVVPPPVLDEEIDEVVEVKPDEETWDESETAPIVRPSDKTGRLMLINVAEGDEGRIAILHQNRLEELFIERASAESHVGNIYKGRITNVEPSIQAAFVDFGLPKNGFLHISDLQPQYFPGGMHTVEEVGRKTPRRERPPIQKCLRRGQELIVQIIKEGIGTKGPTLTTYISIPGRYLVMMPGMNRLGVSRRIEDEDARRKMRGVLDELELPKDMGFILRTAGMDRTKRELQQDLMYLQRLWKVVAQRIKSERAPCELYRESDLVIRTIRDVFSADFSRIIVDDEKTAEKVRTFLSIATPRSVAPVDLYAGRRPLFHEYKLEQEIERINSRYVPLASGGSLVIESTEALVAIDVNSGRFRDHDDAEETAFRINIEAAEEIARQLRLRDLGGLILCDFVDMRMEKHRRGVERALRDALKKHKERAKCLRMSQFGIIEMTRQRMRPSIKRSIYSDCPHCRGSGLVKNAESMTLDIMRLLQLATHYDQVDMVEVRVATAVAFQLQNQKRAILHQLESESSRRIVIRADENLGPDQFSFECLDSRGGIIRLEGLPEGPRQNVEIRSKRRAGSQPEQKGFENPRETLEDVFD